MTEYLRPGIYVEEKKFGTPPVVGGSSSVGAFVGFAPRGKRNDPFFVSSWTDFVNKTADGADSPFMKNAYLAYAVYGFFLNGGQSAWIVLAGDGSEAKATISISNGTNPISIMAKDEGAWGNKLGVKIVANADGVELYDFEVYKGSALLETHVGVSLAANAEKPFVEYINANSKYVDVDTNATTMDPTSVGSMKLLASGSDGLSAITDAKLAEAMKKFDLVDSINLLVSPESQTLAMSVEGTAYAENRKDCVYIADGGQNDDFEAVLSLKEGLPSDFGGLYYPWIEVSDPIGGIAKNKFIPCGGHVAGMIARNDNARGVFKAPAGTEAVVRGALSVKTKINDEQHKLLNPKNVNVIRVFPDAGIIVYGARTMAGSYLNVRRELNYIMDAIPRSTRWSAFEPNNEDLWRKLRNQILSFLETRRVDGAYKGAGEGTAYFVKSDAELNTQAEIDAGRVNVEIGVAINKPGEFIIFRVGQWEGGSSVQ